MICALYVCICHHKLSFKGRCPQPFLAFHLPSGHQTVWVLRWNWSPEGLTMLNGLITFCLSLHRSPEDALEHTRGRGQPGLCSYGQTTSCCLGWRNVNGICQRKSVSVTAWVQWHITQFTGYQFNISGKQQILGNTCWEVLVLGFLVLFLF